MVGAVIPMSAQLFLGLVLLLLVGKSRAGEGMSLLQLIAGAVGSQLQLCHSPWPCTSSQIRVTICPGWGTTCPVPLQSPNSAKSELLLGSRTPRGTQPRTPRALLDFVQLCREGALPRSWAHRSCQAGTAQQPVPTPGTVPTTGSCCWRRDWGKVCAAHSCRLMNYLDAPR